MDTVLDILVGGAFASIFVVVGLASLALAYFVFDAITPGHRVGDRLNPRTGPSQASHSAALVLSAWMIAQGAIIANSIWINGRGEDFWAAIAWTVAWSVIGQVLQAIAFLVLDKLTPGKLGDEVCTPGPVIPLAKVAAANVIAVAIIVLICMH